MKICPVAAEFSMQTDGEKDIAKLIDAIRNFANTPKNAKRTF